MPRGHQRKLRPQPKRIQQERAETAEKYRRLTLLTLLSPVQSLAEKTIAGICNAMEVTVGIRLSHRTRYWKGPLARHRWHRPMWLFPWGLNRWVSRLLRSLLSP